MYFVINKAFLRGYSKADLLSLFPHIRIPPRIAKAQMIKEIISECSHDDYFGPCNSWLHICPYCRSQCVLKIGKRSNVSPQFCSQCGRTSPLHAFERNVVKASQLMLLASKMNRKKERDTKDVLLEQALVAIITGLEVLMRETYSLIYDHRHVVMGISIFDDAYTRTRNEFLNLGSASRLIRKVTRLNIKKEMASDRYKFLSRMYSVRHIVVHNSSIKDKNFLSQTGDLYSELNKPIRLRVPDIRSLVRVTSRLARQLNKELRRCLLDFQHGRLHLVRGFQSSEKRKSGDISLTVKSAGIKGKHKGS